MEVSNSKSLRDTAEVVRGTHGRTGTDSRSMELCAALSDIVLVPNKSPIVEKDDDKKSRFSPLSNRVNICNIRMLNFEMS
jgi:hypothetical protein